MPESIPLFPLGTVLLPGASLPLHVFEPRYRRLTTDLVTGAVPGKSFGVVAVRSGRDGSEGDIEALHGVGCTARLKEVSRLPDGRFDIVTTGERRFKVLAVEKTASSYLSATVQWLPDDEMSAQESQHLLPRLVLAARAAHHRYCEVAWKRNDWTPPDDEVDAALLSHLLAADCLLPLEDRQALLEERSSVRRLRLVRRVISRETHILSELRAIPVPLEQVLLPMGLN
ncbi:MAG: LON peptidase substrate-binding domain-containing protein [Mycobacteriaceae bacterium]